MRIKLYEGKVDICDQLTIDTMARSGQLELICEFNNYKEALEWLIQALNNEDLDIVNNFYTIITD